MTSKQKLKFINAEFASLDLDRHDSRIIDIWYTTIEHASILNTKEEITQLIIDHLDLKGV